MSDILIRFKLRRGTAANLASVNEVPLAGELVVETDTGKAKLGNGTTAYNSLAYWNAGSVAPGAITGSGLTMATARLLGRTTASTGAVEEITVGRGLSLASGTLLWPGHPGYAAGGYYLADGIGVAATPSANTSNTIYFHPFLLLADTTIDSLLARVTTAAASGLFQMALYAADTTTRLPTGAALYSSSSQSTTSAATIEDTGPSLALKAGLYWAATNKDTTAATAAFLSVSVSQFRVAQTVPAQTATGLMTGTATSLCGYSKSQTFGTWPTLTGSYATDSLAQITSTIIPVIGFKAA